MEGNPEDDTVYMEAGAMAYKNMGHDTGLYANDDVLTLIKRTRKAEMARDGLAEERDKGNENNRELINQVVAERAEIQRLTGIIGEAVHFLSSGHGITVAEGQRQLKAMLEGEEAGIYRHALRKSERHELTIQKIADLAASAAAYPLSAGRFVEPADILRIIELGKL